MNLEQFINWCNESSQKHIKIIANWAEIMKPDFETKGQWTAFLKRHIRPAKELIPFSEEQLSWAREQIRKDQAWLKKPTLETILKYLT